ncbi:YbaN family protein [Dysgonomonas sp. GY617]|uniref:YbaN family protein n=1 Tax=Dysgonomonas sp. GY617 TaxID=2780420 RepID=UPI0018843BA7|nr:YbaN family protein [Dysgonomonas sp. GY617]MBF0575841.1 YbaN family protein [Dysgonomonas sp. GY617]
MKKYTFITLGTISLILGLLGLFTPGLPTTPFILLTGALYAKSSPQLYKRLEENKLTGKYLKRMETGLSWKVRLLSICFMWCMVCVTAFLVFDADSKMRYVMLGLGVVGTVAQLIALRKRKPKIELQEIQQVIETSEDIDSVDVSYK